MRDPEREAFESRLPDELAILRDLLDQMRRSYMNRGLPAAGLATGQILRAQHFEVHRAVKVSSSVANYKCIQIFTLRVLQVSNIRD